MDNVNSQFHSLIIDEDVPQILLLCECDLNTSFKGNFYLSSDGDMESNGARFVDDMTQGEEYALGCVACRTLNVSIMNLDGYLNGHNFGWLQAYIGARYAHTAYTPSADENCRLVYYRTFYGKTTGFYDSSTLVQSGNCVGLYSMTDGYVYFFMESGGDISAYSYNINTNAVADATQFSKAMLAKMSRSRGVRINGAGYYYEFVDGYDDDYYLACLGNFQVDRPKKTIGDTIDITDAFDAIHQLDVPANYTQFSATNGYYLFNGIVTVCGLSVDYASEVVSNRLKELPVDVGELMNNGYSCRRVLSYLCEAVGCNARLKPKTRQVYVYMPDQTTASLAYPVTADRVATQGIEVQEFTTHPIECVAVKSLENTSLLYPRAGGDYIYEYNGNPFVKDATWSLLTYVRQMPHFTPMSIDVINADPSFQSGDLMYVSLTYGEDENLTTHDDEDITTYSDEDILVTPSIGSWIIPIMSQSLTFDGRCRATIEAKGTEDRSGTTYDNDYTDTNARSSKYLSSDYIIWSAAYNPVEVLLQSDKSLSAQTTTCTEILSFSLEPGTWLVLGQVEFSAVVSRKVVTLSDVSGQYHSGIGRNDSDTSTSQTTDVQCLAVLKPTVAKTYYLNANSSAACSAKATYSFVRALRII